MMSFKLPSMFIFGDRPGLLVGDDEVMLVNWRGGVLRQIAVYDNDENGIALFAEHLTKHRYRNMGFFVVANVVGEDYRHEKVAHLTGKNKIDFHNRRMRQLFRGSSFFMSDTQGRDNRGKREDVVLFFGVLAAGKIDPWLAAIAKGGERYTSGVHGIPYIISHLRPALPKPSANSIVATFHEGNTMRLTFFSGNHLRFSRLAKVGENADAPAVAAALKRELDRTLQYLNTLRVFTEGKLTVDCICPGGSVSPLTEAAQSSGRLEYRFHSAETLHKKMGVKKTLTAAGRDSSLPINELCRRVVVSQLAPWRQVMHYWIKLGANAAMALFIAYGAYSYYDAATTFSEGLFDYATENDSTENLLSGQKSSYQREFADIGEPPSSAQNVKAVATTFNSLSAMGITPTRMLYYLSGAMAKSGEVSLDDVRWYLSGDAIAPPGDGSEVAGGGKLYQILEVLGTAGGDTQLQVAANARQLVASFDKRGDIHIEEVVMPPEQLGELADEFTPLERVFSLRLIWRDGEDFPPDFNPRAAAQTQAETG